MNPALLIDGQSSHPTFSPVRHAPRPSRNFHRTHRHGCLRLKIEKVETTSTFRTSAPQIKSHRLKKVRKKGEAQCCALVLRLAWTTELGTAWVIRSVGTLISRRAGQFDRRSLHRRDWQSRGAAGSHHHQPARQMRKCRGRIAVDCASEFCQRISIR